MLLLKPSSWSDKNSESQLFLFIGMIFVFYFFSYITAGIAAFLFWGVNIGNPAELADISSPLVLKTMKFVQIIGSIGTFIIPPFLMAYLISEKPLLFLGLREKTHFPVFLLIVISMLANIPIINILAEWNSRLILPEFLSGIETFMRSAEKNAEKITKLFLETDSSFGLILNIFMVALLPALGEELVFRGIIQKLLIRLTNNIHWGILISAFLFSAMHFQFYGFVPRAFLGVFFGYLFVWSKNIWLPIFAHFFNNAAAVLMDFLERRKLIPYSPDKIGIEGSSSYFLLGISLVVFLACLFYIYNGSKKEIEKDTKSVSF